MLFQVIENHFVSFIATKIIEIFVKYGLLSFITLRGMFVN